MALLIVRALLAVSLIFVALPHAVAAERVALVIGNSSYQHVSRLPNPVNDATDISNALKRLGFEVRIENDVTYGVLRRALRDFSRQAARADFAVVYYAGHGMEVNKHNYVIPVDAELKSDLDIDYEAVPLDLVMNAVDGASVLKLVLLDSCRNNPFAASMKMSSGKRAIGRGLARVEPEVGTLVSFAAKEGTTADDGDGRNSPYTTALLKHLEQPGLEIQFLFRKVRDSVMAATNRRQQPFTYGSLPGNEIYLKVPEAVTTTALPQSSDVQEQLEALRKKLEQKDQSATQIAQLKAQLERQREEFETLKQQALKRDQKLAKLPPATQSPPQPEDLVGHEALALKIQQHLQRVGCDPGRPDGAWGAKSRRALQAFARHAKLRFANLDPSQDVLKELSDRKARVCPAEVEDANLRGAATKSGRSQYDGLWKFTKPASLCGNSVLVFNLSVRNGKLYANRGQLNADGTFKFKGTTGQRKWFYGKFGKNSGFGRYAKSRCYANIKKISQ